MNHVRAPRGIRLLEAVLAVLLVASIATTFAPWLRTGDRERTSHEVVRAADRLGVLDDGIRPAGVVVWAFTPALAAVGVLALARDRRRLAAGAAAVVAVVQGGFALAVSRAPDAALAWGVTAAVAVAAAMMVVAAAVAASTTRSNR